MTARLVRFFDLIGLQFMVPMTRLAAGESPRQQARELWMMVGVPLVALGIFLLLWHLGAARIQTSLGTIPGPLQVWTEFTGLPQTVGNAGWGSLLHPDEAPAAAARWAASVRSG
ncbi:MAG TPA: hypothetical protein PLK97_08785, partial [Pseudomonadales bacterium]|nr:hypothetical protein [Pseudomonadales bacterium]